MPITFQHLGAVTTSPSGNGLFDLKISANPNTRIDLKYPEGVSPMPGGIGTGLVGTTDENGDIIFKDLPEGVWTAFVRLPNNSFCVKNIKIAQYQDELPTAQIKDLPLGAKLKFSNGIKMTLMNKNLELHAPNSATFFGEYIFDSVEVQKESGLQYGHFVYYEYPGTLLQTRLHGYFMELKKDERRAFLTHKVIWNDYERENKIEQNFYLPSKDAFGIYDPSNPSIDTNLGFTDATSRIRTYENGASSEYCSSYIYENEIGGIDYDFVTKDGNMGYTDGVDLGNLGINKLGIVPACDLKQNTCVHLGEDGYYTIVDAKIL